MRAYLQTAPAGLSTTGTSLYTMANNLCSELMPVALRSKSVLINDVAAELFTAAQENTIAPFLRQVISAVLRNARFGHIHLSAEKFADVVTITVEDRNNYNGYALSSSIAQLEPLARVMGGFLSLKGAQQLTATISFSFPDQLLAIQYQ